MKERHPGELLRDAMRKVAPELVSNYSIHGNLDTNPADWPELQDFHPAEVRTHVLRAVHILLGDKVELD